MSLDELRDEVDRVDGELVRLLNERAGLAASIGDEKRRNAAPIHDPVREDAVIERITSASGGPLDDEAVRAIYRAIIRECSRIQEKPPETK
ncbi:MAG: chorismate mutase [Lentisphaerae bacterium]|nr:chorismate mutase [Lentisphaerota bacterium]